MNLDRIDLTLREDMPDQVKVTLQGEELVIQVGQGSDPFYVTLGRFDDVAALVAKVRQIAGNTPPKPPFPVFNRRSSVFNDNGPFESRE
jgi:hypothetical protein